jgi:hypothetical protein
MLNKKVYRVNIQPNLTEWIAGKSKFEVYEMMEDTYGEYKMFKIWAELGYTKDDEFGDFIDEVVQIETDLDSTFLMDDGERTTFGKILSKLKSNQLPYYICHEDLDESVKDDDDIIYFI